MHFSFHDVALCGCSWRKYLPSAICSKYILVQNSKCTFDRLCCSSTFSEPPGRQRFKFCKLLHAVHGGLPIRRYGFCSLINWRALSRQSRLEKSQTCPLQSGAVKSRLNPPLSPAACATVTIRGGLYTSDMSFLQFNFFLTTAMSRCLLSALRDSIAIASRLRCLSKCPTGMLEPGDDDCAG